MAIPALARFASDTFDRVLQVASGDRDASKVADALSTLQKIVSLDIHPPGMLDRVVEVARARMTTTDSPMVWQNALDLALTTRDRRLRGMVGQMAEGALEPPFSARRDLRLWVRSAAQRALKRDTRR
jgi:hypothetical protein